MYVNNDQPKTTKVVFSSEARKSLFQGMQTVARAVGSTLGPRGKTVLIQQSSNSQPIITKDGVTVSKSINLKTPIERMGAQLIREAASQTNEIAGDGTTTATVLTFSMVKSGLKLLEAGYDAKVLCSGITSASEAVSCLLKESAKQLTTVEEIAQIGTISANGDKSIGHLIADAMTKVGHDGIITVEEAKSMQTQLDVVEGMQIDRGYLSPYFVTNNEKMHAAYSDAKVLLVDQKLNSMREMLPLLEKVLQSKVPLLVIADEVEGEALQGLVVNRINAHLPVVAIKAPGYGKSREEFMRDIAVMTGAKIVSPSTGLSMSKTTMSDLGSLKSLLVDAKSTTMVGTGATKQSINAHVEELKIQLRDITLTQEEAERLRLRVARLSSGVAIIKVGGATELEIIETKYRIEDALNATRAAVDEGIVPGGGMALFEIWRKLSSDKDSGWAQFGTGGSIVADACLAPIQKISENAEKSHEVIISDLMRQKKEDNCPEIGYNAASEEYVNMIETGIIDPVKVTRTALRNAASVACTFLSLDAVIVEEDDEQE